MQPFLIAWRVAKKRCKPPFLFWIIRGLDFHKSEAQYEINWRVEARCANPHSHLFILSFHCFTKNVIFWFDSIQPIVFVAAFADHLRRLLLSGYVQRDQFSSLGRGGWLVVWSPVDLVHTWMGHLPDIQPPKGEGIPKRGTWTLAYSPLLFYFCFLVFLMVFLRLSSNKGPR